MLFLNTEGEYAHLNSKEKKLLEATLTFQAAKRGVRLCLAEYDFKGDDDFVPF